jgi:hypothetical protein
MALCREYGIPHSQFLGAGDGTWTPRDRAKARAYEEFLRTVCPQCGTRESEWVTEDGEYEDAYIAVTHRCFGCEEIANKQDEVPEGKAGAGVKVLLLPASIRAAQEVLEELTAR